MAAAVTSSDASSAVAAEGPVMAVINKRLRALRKKLNRIVQMEESVAQGKTLNKEQEEVLRSKPAVLTIIEELERLRQPISSALQEELSAVRESTPPPPPSAPSSTDEAVDASTVPSPEEEKGQVLQLEDLLKLLYFGNLFDVKPLSEYETTMLMRTHERECCITYDPVTDDTISPLEEKDLDPISALGSLVLSRPPNSSVSHRNALLDCLHHARLWLDNSQQTIHPGSAYTYAGIRERLNRILASDYATATPEFKPSVDLAAEVGKFTVGQVLMSDPTAHTEHDHEESGQPFIEGEDLESSQRDAAMDQVNDPNEAAELDGPDAPNHYGDQIPPPQELEKVEEEEHNQRDLDPREHQYPSRRPFPNQRGGSRGGGGGFRRGYVNGRGGRGGRGGGGGYQNGRGQFYDSGYHPRGNNFYNGRGRGGRNGGGYNHGAVYGGHAPGVELGAS